MAQWNIGEKELKEQFERARERAREADAKEPRAKSARYDAATGEIVIELVNTAKFSFPARMAQGLVDASPEDLAAVEVTPSGDGLQWESLDVDLDLLGIIRGIFGTKAWMAHLGQVGGQATTQAKAEAARVNGMKGGRPKKSVETVHAHAHKTSHAGALKSKKDTKSPRSVYGAALSQNAKTHVRSDSKVSRLTDSKSSHSRHGDKSLARISGKSRKK